MHAGIPLMLAVVTATVSLGTLPAPSETASSSSSAGVAWRPLVQPNADTDRVQPAPRDDLVPKVVRASSERGVKYLLRAQNRDGSWGDDHGSPGDLGNTAIAVLALVGHGSTPTRGKHAYALRRNL